MTIAFSDRSVSYDAAGGEPEFGFPFPLKHKADLAVTIRRGEGDLPLTLDLHYTVAIAGNGLSATIFLVANEVAALAGDVWLLDGAKAIERATAFLSHRKWDHEAVNEEFDRVHLFLQELRRDVNRAVKRHGIDVSGASNVLPAEDVGVLILDADGNVSLVPLSSFGGGGGPGFTLPLGVDEGGTGANNAADARNNLGLGALAPLNASASILIHSAFGGI